MGITTTHGVRRGTPSPAQADSRTAWPNDQQELTWAQPEAESHAEMPGTRLSGQAVRLHGELCERRGGQACPCLQCQSQNHWGKNQKAGRREAARLQQMPLPRPPTFLLPPTWPAPREGMRPGLLLRLWELLEICE